VCVCVCACVCVCVWRCVGECGEVWGCVCGGVDASDDPKFVRGDTMRRTSRCMMHHKSARGPPQAMCDGPKAMLEGRGCPDSC
jgi:hypothetical protein